MPRAMWSGSISFGLVNIPVKLFNAVSRKSVHFNQIDSRSGSRIKYKKVSAADETEVPNDAIVKGYEWTSGQYVLVDDDELASLDPEAARSVDIEEFVDLDEIDPIFYDAAYYVAPDRGALKSYALLAEAMEQANKVGIARFVMRSKQYLAAIRPQDGRLVLSTMVYADELNEPESIGELEGVAGVELSEKELTMARQLIESLSSEFEPSKFEDTHRNRVLELIERKASGETVVSAPQPAAADKVVDLMAALEASVAAAKESRQRHPTARRGDGTAAGDDDGAGDAEPAASGARKARSA